MSIQNKAVSIIIPTLNESPNLEILVSRINKYLKKKYLRNYNY